MVSIHGNWLARWRARRRVLAAELRAGHAMGPNLVDMAVIFRAYRRAQREVSHSLTRSRPIRLSSFNLNALSSQQSLSLFRFLPNDIGQLALLLDVDVYFPRARLSVDAVERLCIVFRWLACPSRWVHLEEQFGRSSTSLCIILHANVEAIMAKRGFLISEWRVHFMR